MIIRVVHGCSRPYALSGGDWLSLCPKFGPRSVPCIMSYLTVLMCSVSQIRLVTTQNSSADTIRLWLERSGDTASLDIEIFLRVNSTTTETTSRARSVSPSSWAYPLPPPGGSAPATYVIAQPTHTPLPLTGLPPSHTPIIIPPSPSHHDPWGSPPHPSSSQQQLGPQSKASMHWGHIAIFYLVGQMHRWERFVFRFDKQFTSMAALKSIAGKYNHTHVCQ